MVRTQTTAEISRPFVRRDPVAGDVPFEFSTFRRLRTHLGVTGIQRRERSTFDLVIAPTRGHGTHEVDFQTVHLDRNHWLYVRSGQMHRWGPVTYDADLIVLEPIAAAAAWAPGPHGLVFTDPQLDEMAPVLEFAKIERRLPDLRVMDVTRDLLFEWMQQGASEEQPNSDLYVNFRNLLEVAVVDLRNVDAYAVRLGVTKQDLVEACLNAGHQHPQTLIEQALLLEVKRLLAHPRATVEAVAATLDFDTRGLEKFFRRAQGLHLHRWLAVHAS